MRGLAVTAILLCAGLAAAGCGSSGSAAQTTTATSASAVQEAPCASQQQPGIVADFGHFASVAAANRMIERARAVGFQGLEVQRRSCNDFAVVLRGLQSVRQGRSLQREARAVGLTVRLDCRSQPPHGGLAAVFGRRRTRRAAQRLAAEAEHVGFQGLQIVQDRCNDWEVVLYGIQTAAQRRAFAREARHAGFHVKFESG